MKITCGPILMGHVKVMLVHVEKNYGEVKMEVAIFITGVLLLLLVLEVIYWTRFRGQPIDVYNPLVSWTRAGIVFCSCFIISWATGTMNKILAAPLFTPEQLKNPQWIAWTGQAASFLLS
ncbi:MAG: hypothetical protein GKB99_05050 [Methanocellales archaeon]|nr:hypothetical protein [Methanocellales archaeon]